MGALYTELVEGQNGPIAFTPDARGLSATVEFRSAEDVLKASVSATLSLVNSVVASVGASPDLLTVDTVAGMAVGDEYSYESIDGWRAKARVSTIVGLVVTLDGAPPGTPKVGDALKGLTFTATIPSSATTTRGSTYSLLWQVTDGAGVVTPQVERAAVVRAKFRDPATPDQAARLAQDIGPGWARVQTPGRWRRIADRANALIRGLLFEAQDFPHLVYNRAAFTMAADEAMRFALSELGVVPSSAGDLTSYQNRLDARLASAVRGGVAASWVDRNEDKRVDPDEAMGTSSSRIMRV